MKEPEVSIDDQLRIAKGLVPSDSPAPSPLAVATLLFEDAKEFAHNNLLRFVIDRGAETGVSVGGFTAPFSRLGVPDGLHVAGVVNRFLGHGKVYEPKHNVREVKTGILLLAGDQQYSYWLWSIVYAPYFTSDPECVYLDVGGLTELMTTPADPYIKRPVLDPLDTYARYVQLINRKLDMQLRICKLLGYHFGRSAAQLERLREMNGELAI